jgi:hypothetical protein
MFKGEQENVTSCTLVFQILPLNATIQTKMSNFDRKMEKVWEANLALDRPGR